MCFPYSFAKTILVFVTFSIVNFVFPPFPATRPMALDRWSPFKGLTKNQTSNHKNFRKNLLSYGKMKNIDKIHVSYTYSFGRNRLFTGNFKEPTIHR